MGRIIKEKTLTGTVNQEIAQYEKDHGVVARKAAASGMVLLKNEGSVLPIKAGSAVALFGAGASRTIKGGTGSGDVNERKSVSIYEGLTDAGYVITTRDWIDDYENLYESKRQEWKEAIEAKSQNESMEFVSAYFSTPFHIPAGPQVYETDTDTAIYVISRIAGEGADRMADKGDYYLDDEEEAMLSRICSLYENVLVIVNTGGVIDLSFMDTYPQIKSLLVISQPGQAGGYAVADVISGAVTPGGKLTDTWAYKYEDYPNSKTYSHNNGNVDKERYEEGIYVGYRYFDAFNVPVRYGFGYGLSYTDFEMTADAVKVQPDGGVSVTVTVKNTGSQYSGSQVVQVYVSLPAGTLEKEVRRLCAFAKTKALAPGEAQTLTLAFGAQDMASYDEKRAAWILEAGSYGVFVGDSLESSRLCAVLDLSQEKITAQAQNICPLQEALKELTIDTDARKARMDALMADASAVSCISYDLSAMDTVVFDYDYKEKDDEAARIVSGLTQEQLILLATGDPGKGQGSLLGSAGISVPGSAGQTSSCAYEQGVADIVLADGPAGLRLNKYYAMRDGQMKTLPFKAAFENGFFFEGESLDGTYYYQYCTAFPVGTLLAQSWDTALIEQVGDAVADELERFNVTLWLAPGMNIHRNPLCGRNFEYYSEDPLVSGKIAAAMTKGVQSHPGCGTTIKHYACNNQEDNRKGSDSILTEKTLREMYLRSFGIAIHESHPMSLMTSYNLINGVHAANNYDLCTKVARCEFGFDGVIMTDWTTTEGGDDCTASRCMSAGNDLVMPGQPTDHENIRQALADGSLDLKDLQDCITRLVRVVLRSNEYER